MDERRLDGNAAAGELQGLLAVEVTSAVGVCAACALSGPLGEAHLYGGDGPGLVLRCPRCTEVLARLVRLPDRTLLELRGLARLELERADPLSAGPTAGAA